jgi:hypothetical protein
VDVFGIERGQQEGRLQHGHKGDQLITKKEKPSKVGRLLLKQNGLFYQNRIYNMARIIRVACFFLMDVNPPSSPIPKESFQTYLLVALQ